MKDKNLITSACWSSGMILDRFGCERYPKKWPHSPFDKVSYSRPLSGQISYINVHLLLKACLRSFQYLNGQGFLEMNVPLKYQLIIRMNLENLT